MVSCWFGAFSGLDSWNPLIMQGIVISLGVRFESQPTKRPKPTINHWLTTLLTDNLEHGTLTSRPAIGGPS